MQKIVQTHVNSWLCVLPRSACDANETNGRIDGQSVTKSPSGILVFLIKLVPLPPFLKAPYHSDITASKKNH